MYNPQFVICCKTWYVYNLWCCRVFRWNLTWFSDWALRFLNLKKCAKKSGGNGLEIWKPGLKPTPGNLPPPKKFKVSKPRLEVLLIIKNFKVAIRGKSHYIIILSTFFTFNTGLCIICSTNTLILFCCVLDLSVKSPCLHPVFGRAFTALSLSQWYLQSNEIFIKSQYEMLKLGI